MKKNIILFVSLFAIPCLLTFMFSIFSDEIQIGKGGNSIEDHFLGKKVLIEINGLYKSIDVEEYVLGILPGTIPIDYDEETLKVQATLIRTNVLKEMQEKNTEDVADLSYKYMSVEDRIAMWGDYNYEKNERKIEKAVSESAGEVIKNEGSLIMALYHEVSIGKTASSKEVMGEDISYLQSVDSSHDVEAKHYMNIISYTWEEISQLNSGSASSVATTQQPTSETTNSEAASTEMVNSETISTETVNTESTQTEITSTESTNTEETSTVQDTTEKINKPEAKNARAIVSKSTENGFVEELTIDGIIYTGQEAMERFKLSSTNFYVEEMDGGVRFVCLGKGSCLGLSQYGANCMAINGKNMEEIIKYYYKGVSIADYK